MIPVKLIRFFATAEDPEGNVYDASFGIEFQPNLIKNSVDVNGVIHFAINQFHEYHPRNGIITSKREATIVAQPTNPGTPPE